MKALGEDPADFQRLAKAAIGGFTDYIRDPAAFRKLDRELLQVLSAK